MDSKGANVCQDGNIQRLMDIMLRTPCNKEVPLWLYINTNPVITGHIRMCSHRPGDRRDPCRRLPAKSIFIESTKTNNLPVHVNGESALMDDR